MGNLQALATKPLTLAAMGVVAVSIHDTSLGKPRKTMPLTR